MANNDKTFVAYFQSWSEKWSDDPQKLQLANIAPYVNMVIVSFMRPDAIYDGNNSHFGTGLDFSADGTVVKDASAYLKSKNPDRYKSSEKPWAKTRNRPKKNYQRHFIFAE